MDPDPQGYVTKETFFLSILILNGFDDLPRQPQRVPASPCNVLILMISNDPLTAPFWAVLWGHWS